MELRGLRSKKPLVQLSDKCREWRFTVRRVRELLDQTNRDVGSSYVIVSTASAAATLFDKALTTIESGVLATVSSDVQSHKGNSPAYPIIHTVYPALSSSLAEGPPAPQRSDSDQALRFSREMYFMAKRALHLAGVQNYLLHQSLLAEVWTDLDVIKGDSNSLRSRSDFEPEVYRPSARLAIKCLEIRPLAFPKTVDSPTGESVNANEFFAMTLALIGAVSSCNHVDASNQALFDGLVFDNCVDTVFALHKEISQHLNSPQAEQEIIEFLSKWCPRLP